MNVIVAALFGLAFGSFVNAAVDRIPRGAPLHGRSYCDGCGVTLGARNLVPVVSYIVQRGRCTACAAPIGLRTPAVELGCATAFAVAFATLAAPAAIVACAAIVAGGIAAGASIVKRSSHP